MIKKPNKLQETNNNSWYLYSWIMVLKNFFVSANSIFLSNRLLSSSISNKLGIETRIVICYEDISRMHTPCIRSNTIHTYVSTYEFLDSSRRRGFVGSTNKFSSRGRWKERLGLRKTRSGFHWLHSHNHRNDNYVGKWERRRDVEQETKMGPDSYAGQLPPHPSLIILVSIELIAILCSIGPAFSSSYGSRSIVVSPSLPRSTHSVNSSHRGGSSKSVTWEPDVYVPLGCRSMDEDKWVVG